MPLAQSYNTLAQNNEQPEYQMLWEALAINPASATTAIATPATLVPAWIVGAPLMYGLTAQAAGVGTNPGPGGDNSTITWTSGVPSGYTVQYVDLAATTTVTYAAGILLGVGGLGLNAPVAPNSTTLNGALQLAMVGKRGICQVLFDASTTLGHTFISSTTIVGECHDTGGATRTYGTTFGVILQSVTASGTIPPLAWCHVNMP